MPGRAITRARCRAAGALTTTTLSQRHAPSVSNSSGMSSTTSGARRARAWRRKCSWLRRTRGKRMRLQPAKRGRIAKDATAETRAIDTAGNSLHARKRRRHRCHRRAPGRQQAVDRGVAVMHGKPEPAQHRGRRALAHADRAGEAKNDHGASVASTAARSAGVTSGRMPNQAAKPGRA